MFGIGPVRSDTAYIGPGMYRYGHSMV